MYIPYGRQSISEEDIQAVVDVLRSDYLTTGPKVAEFENIVANYVGASVTNYVCCVSKLCFVLWRKTGVCGYQTGYI